MSIETYKKSMEIEFFLKRVLRVKPGTRAHNDLKGYYESIVFYEEGNVRITPSEHKKYVQRFLKYFEKAIDKMSKKESEKQMLAERLKTEMRSMQNSSDILYLYNQVKKLGS